MKLTEVKDIQYKIFLDLDGVVAAFDDLAAELMGMDVKDFPSANGPKVKDFDNKLWAVVRSHIKGGNEFWGEMDLMKDAMTLWNYVKDKDVEILSSTGGNFKTADGEKRRWVKKHFGNVKVNLVDTSSLKAKYAKDNYILVDDRNKSLGPWKAAGGIGILHTSAAKTIKQLKKLGI